MDINKIEELKQKLESLGSDLSARDKKFTLDEANALIEQINAEIEAYIVAMKTLELKQSMGAN